MKVEDLSAMRTGVELAAMKPYIDAEVDAMQRAVVNNVHQMVNDGTLTPEIALSKWMEYIAYRKLNQKFLQKINIGHSIGTTVDMKSL